MSGPPEFPGLIAASVWIMLVSVSVASLPSSPAVTVRPSAETMPWVTVGVPAARPSALPMATTASPTTAVFESPKVTVGSPEAPWIWRSATSLDGSVPISVAGSELVVPDWVTVMVPPPPRIRAITWLLVTTSPDGRDDHAGPLILRCAVALTSIETTAGATLSTNLGMATPPLSTAAPGDVLASWTVSVESERAPAPHRRPHGRTDGPADQGGHDGDGQPVAAGAPALAAPATTAAPAATGRDAPARGGPPGPPGTGHNRGARCTVAVHRGTTGGALGVLGGCHGLGGTSGAGLSGAGRVGASGAVVATSASGDPAAPGHPEDDSWGCGRSAGGWPAGVRARSAGPRRAAPVRGRGPRRRPVRWVWRPAPTRGAVGWRCGRRLRTVAVLAHRCPPGVRWPSCRTLYVRAPGHGRIAALPS